MSPASLPDARSIGSHGHSWVVLSRIRSVTNLGSLCRCIDAAGGAGVILVGNEIDRYSPDLIRASMGSFFRRRIVSTTWNEFAVWQQEHGCTTVGATPTATQCFREARYTNPTLIMLGDERNGLSTRQKSHCDQFVQIPVRPETDSLNVAVAGSLILYEIQRHYPLVVKPCES